MASTGVCLWPPRKTEGVMSPLDELRKMPGAERYSALT